MKNDKALFDCLIIESEKDGIMGIATYFYAYFSWVGKSLYLDDFIIRKDVRRTGLGQRLFNQIVKEAKANHCKRMRWEMTDDNANAREFYNQYNIEFHNDIIVCQLEF